MDTGGAGMGCGCTCCCGVSAAAGGKLPVDGEGMGNEGGFGVAGDGSEGVDKVGRGK